MDVKLVALLIGVILAGGCSDTSDKSAAADGTGRDAAKTACRSFNEAWQSASDRVDAINESGEELAHPAHDGEDGFNATEWQRFEDASKSADRAASKDKQFEPLAASLRDVLDAKGASGVGAAVAFEPMGDTFDECYEHDFLSRP